MQEELRQFIQSSSFPCIMAKAVAKTGLLKVATVENLTPDQYPFILQQLWDFTDELRTDEDRLSSFTLVLKDPSLHDFKAFEKRFWELISCLHQMDKEHFPHDPRVSSDPRDERFGYSIKAEAYFLVALHPQSPRWARRFKHPAIVFNPHRQFEKLREKRIFKKVRDIIRHKDKLFQGSINPMLSDFGEKSEVFQYLGRVYAPTEEVRL